MMMIHGLTMIMMMMIHGLLCSSITHLMVVVYNNYLYVWHMALNWPICHTYTFIRWPIHPLINEYIYIHTCLHSCLLASLSCGTGMVWREMTFWTQDPPAGPPLLWLLQPTPCLAWCDPTPRLRWLLGVSEASITTTWVSLYGTGSGVVISTPSDSSQEWTLYDDDGGSDDDAAV